MVNVRENLSLFILIAIVLLIIVSNVIRGDQSNTIPTSKYRWFAWEIDRNAAIAIKFGEILGGMAVVAAVFWKDFKAIKGIAIFYAIIAGVILPNFLTNDPDFSYIDYADIGLLVFPALLAVLRLTGRLRPPWERTEAEKQEIRQKQDETKQEISEFLEFQTRYWWLKWLPLSCHRYTDSNYRMDDSEGYSRY